MTAARQMFIRSTFADWRSAARQLLAERVPPAEVFWTDERQTPLLPLDEPVTEGNVVHVKPSTAEDVRVPADFLKTAEVVSCHRDPGRWALLYRILWRLTHGERPLLQIASDDDVRSLTQMEKAVRRDRHKMTAFVRFREIDRAGVQHFVAWYEPDNYIVRLTAGHFQKRFAVMNWSILTPDDCVHWDGKKLTFTPGVTQDQAPTGDALEALWLTYYGSIFNPARIKIKAMKKEMPVRFWADLPETHIIPDLLAAAPARVEGMIARSVNLAEVLAKEEQTSPIPDTRSLEVLKSAAVTCTRCPLYEHATQTVFGEGRGDAKIVMVGEQPGDSEDLAGRPFVGPAGQLLDRVLQEVGIDRSAVYVTNAVKHFKFEQRGKRRIHAKPNAREMTACNVWLQHELDIIKPQTLVLLGATAAQSLVGQQFRITKERGKVFETEFAPWTMATWHPSALLRASDESARRVMEEQFANDLRQVAKRISA